MYIIFRAAIENGISKAELPLAITYIKEHGKHTSYSLKLCIASNQ